MRSPHINTPNITKNKQVSDFWLPLVFLSFSHSTEFSRFKETFFGQEAENLYSFITFSLMSSIYADGVWHMQAVSIQQSQKN